MSRSGFFFHRTNNDDDQHGRKKRADERRHLNWLCLCCVRHHRMQAYASLSSSSTSSSWIWCCVRLAGGDCVADTRRLDRKRHSQFNSIAAWHSHWALLFPLNLATTSTSWRSWLKLNFGLLQPQNRRRCRLGKRSNFQVSFECNSTEKEVSSRHFQAFLLFSRSSRMEFCSSQKHNTRPNRRCSRAHAEARHCVYGVFLMIKKLWYHLTCVDCVTWICHNSNDWSFFSFWWTAEVYFSAVDALFMGKLELASALSLLWMFIVGVAGCLCVFFAVISFSFANALRLQPRLDSYTLLIMN